MDYYIVPMEASQCNFKKTNVKNPLRRKQEKGERTENQKKKRESLNKL